MSPPVAVSDLALASDRPVKSPLTRVETVGNDALTRLQIDDCSVLSYPASALEDGPAGVWLRVRGQKGHRLISLSGQQRTSGHVDGFEMSMRRTRSSAHAAWFTHVSVMNRGDGPVEVDLVATQDVALAPLPIVRINEYYVSQYLDLTPVEVPGHGTAVAVRQNMPGTAAPWVILGSLGTVVGWATDAVQLTGVGLPEGEPWPGLSSDLPCERRQGEHTLVALQTQARLLAPGESFHDGFFGWFVADHPEATGPADVAYAEQALADPAARTPHQEPSGDGSDHRSLFGMAEPLTCRDLTADEIATISGPGGLAHAEYAGDDVLAGFTATGDHLVTRAKQTQVLRPHGHLLRSGTELLPQETSVAATVWMDGSFCSHLTQDHVGAGVMLSPRRSYLGLQRAHGLRIFVREPGSGPVDWRLLATPSAWGQGLEHASWWYASGDRLITVRTDVPAEHSAVTVSLDVAGRPVEILVAAHLTWGDPDATAGRLEPTGDGLRVRPPAGARAYELYDEPALHLTWQGNVEIADDAALFVDGRSRSLPWLTFRTSVTDRWALTLTPELVPVTETGRDPDFWSSVGRSVQLSVPDSGSGRELAALDAAMPWFAHDAVVHYLSPRGLEQFSGGAWGTRDVSQGPVGLLLTVGAHAELRELLITIFSAQKATGDWPQAFEFLPRHRGPSTGEAHGDVVYWPLLALAEYVLTTGDTSVLDGQGLAGAGMAARVGAALDHIDSTLISGTGLPAYGHGDWNDSLQPVDPDLAARLCSTWTVTLQAHSLGTLAQALASVAPALADRARRIADRGTADLRRLLLRDGVLPGYGLFDRHGVVEPLIHPRDTRTGLTYSVLPMIHAIAGDLLTPEEARHHLELIGTHLTGPDGVHLFDRPVGYAGGPMDLFQRAEASTFFGREIGLMYMHAHLRYAEALARVGDGPALLRALGQAHPVDLAARVPQARPRQSSCYYSSSDAAFADRYAARDHYADAIAGTVPLEGGWRVYSSGPGLFLRLVKENLLGVRVRGDHVELDPVLDRGLDGLEASVRVGDSPLRLRFRVGERGHGVRTVRVGGASVAGETLDNPYRQGGVRVARAELTATDDTVEVETW